MRPRTATRVGPVATVTLAGLLACAAPAASGEAPLSFDPSLQHALQVRVIAIEQGPDGERAWLGLPQASNRVAVEVGQALANGSLTGIDWETATVTTHVKHPEGSTRLFSGYDRTRSCFGTLSGAPFGEQGCPLFLSRVVNQRAWVRTGPPGQERSLGIGDELCGGWLVAELEDGDDASDGHVTFERADRRLRVGVNGP